MYASFNTSQVGQVSFKIYGGDDPNNVFEDTPLYGDTMSLRYPKVSLVISTQYSLFNLDYPSNICTYYISLCPLTSKAFRHQGFIYLRFISLQTGTQNPLVELTVVNLKKNYEQIKLTPPPSMKQM